MQVQRVLLFLVAMAAIVSICQGARGDCSSSVSQVCAYCQDVNTRCGVCKPGYQCVGKNASNCKCVANAAYACPAAAQNCLSCSPICPGTGNVYLNTISAPNCLTKWNPQWGCSVCASSSYVQVQSSVPLPAGVSQPPKSCNLGSGKVITCTPRTG